jgi:hypothetical protein
VSWILWAVFVIVILFGFVVFRGAPYVPSKRGDVKRALSELYPIGETDTLVDIGSGDGLVLREAAKRGARAIGYELNPLLVVLSRWLSRGNPAVTVYLADFWRVPLPPSTTVVYTFGDSRDIAKMAGKVADAATKLDHPLMFISYGFAVPGMVVVGQVGPHYLYRVEPTVEPLQVDEA